MDERDWELLELHERRGIKSDGKVETHHAIVDKEDMPDLLQYTWYYKVDNANDPKRKHVSIGRNAVKDPGTHRKSSLVLLNRHIMGIDDPKVQVSFKNGDPMDNRKENLVVVMDGHALRRLQTTWLRYLEVRTTHPR